MIQIGKIADDIRDMLFPVRCPVCDRPVRYQERKEGICTECRKRLPLIKNNRCFKCGRMLEKPGEEFCRDCRERRTVHFYEKGLALCCYNDIMRESLYKMKYQGRREYAETYGRIMARYFGNVIKRTGVEGIIPVPLHPKRERERGYNQAALLARAFGRESGIPVYENYLVRARHTPPMKSLSIAERQNNLKRAFKIRHNDVKLSIIIIIDDIYTTGSTIDAMSREFRKAGVERIYFMTLAIGRGI